MFYSKTVFQVAGFAGFAPIFVPSVFIKKDPTVIKHVDDMTDSQKKELERRLPMIRGTQSEQASFTNFVKLFRQAKYLALRIVFFNGIEFLYPDSAFEKEFKGEFDQIIVDESKKAIIYAELKTTFSKSHAIRKRQFERFKSLVDTHFPVGEGWKLVTAYGFTEWPKSQDNGEPPQRPCEACGKHIFFVNDFGSIQRWYNGLDDQIGAVNNSCDNELESTRSSPFKDILATLLFLALVNKKKSKEKQLLTPAMGNEALFKTIQKISGSAENVLFWSDNQHILLTGEYKRLKFTSDYGTGELSCVLGNSKTALVYDETLQAKRWFWLKRPNALLKMVKELCLSLHLTPRMRTRKIPQSGKLVTSYSSHSRVSSPSMTKLSWNLSTFGTSLAKSII